MQRYTKMVDGIRSFCANTGLVCRQSEEFLQSDQKRQTAKMKIYKASTDHSQKENIRTAGQ